MKKEAAPHSIDGRISNEEFRHELAIIAVYFVPGPVGPFMSFPSTTLLSLHFSVLRVIFIYLAHSQQLHTHTHTLVT